MAQYDQADFTQRVLALIPRSWFGDVAWTVTGILYQFIFALMVNEPFHWQQIAYQTLQTRLLTATDTNLDQISSDFFGTELPRISGESDSSFRIRIQQAIIAPKATCQAIQDAANFYFSNIYEEPFNTLYPLMGLNIIGGLNTRGGLNGPDNIVQVLPSVVVWDQITDPEDAATYDIAPPDFVVDIDFPVRTGTGWFLKYTALTYESYVFDTKTLTDLPTDEIDPGLKNVVDETRAEGTVPVYKYHRSIGAVS